MCLLCKSQGLGKGRIGRHGRTGLCATKKDIKRKKNLFISYNNRFVLIRAQTIFLRPILIHILERKTGMKTDLSDILHIVHIFKFLNFK